MPKLDRVDQKIFAINSGNEDKVKFGSLAEGTPQQATDLVQIQERPSFEAGWRSAVLGALSPTLNDRNSLDYLFSYQIAYLLQQGIPEWNDTTEYFEKSIVRGSDGIIYRAITVLTNLNKDPSNGQNEDFWEPVVKPSLTLKTSVVNFTNYRKRDYDHNGEAYYYNTDSSVLAQSVLMAFAGQFYVLAGKGSSAGTHPTADMVSCAVSKTGNIAIGGNKGTSGDPIFHTNGGVFKNIVPVPAVITATSNFRINRVIHINDGTNSYFVGVCNLSSRILVIDESTPTTGTFELVQDDTTTNVNWYSVCYDDVNDKVYIAGVSVSGTTYVAYSEDQGSTWTKVNVVPLAGTTEVRLYCHGGIVYVMQDTNGSGRSYHSIEDNGSVINPFTTDLDDADFGITPTTSVKLPDGRFLIGDKFSDIGYVTSDFRTYEYVAFRGSLPDADSTLVFKDLGPQSLSYFPLLDNVVGWNSNATIMSLTNSTEYV